MAVVYFHKIKDTNEVFYVGIGDKEKRAYTKNSRSSFWKHIVKKYGYDVEIVHTDISLEEACKLETQYIKEFGRRDLGLGNLVNMTDGGEGKSGFIHTEETKIKISKSNKGKKLTEEHKRNLKLNHKGTTGKKHSPKTIEKIKESNIKARTDKKWLKSRNEANTFRILTEQDVIEAIKLYKDGVMNYRELGKKYNVSRTTISSAIQGKSWKYLQEERVEKAKIIKLTKQDIIDIRKEYSKGNISQKSLGKKYNISQSHINAIINKKKWKDI